MNIVQSIIEDKSSDVEKEINNRLHEKSITHINALRQQVVESFGFDYLQEDESSKDKEKDKKDDGDEEDYDKEKPFEEE